MVTGVARFVFLCDPLCGITSLIITSLILPTARQICLQDWYGGSAECVSADSIRLVICYLVSVCDKSDAVKCIDRP